jgi:alanine dehydrogenase
LLKLHRHTRSLATYALTNATLTYAVKLADLGWREALRTDAGLVGGLNTHDGRLTNGPVAEALGLPFTPVAELV